MPGPSRPDAAAPNCTDIAEAVAQFHRGGVARVDSPDRRMSPPLRRGSPAVLVGSAQPNDGVDPMVERAGSVSQLTHWLRLARWPRFPTRYGTATGSWRRLRWSTCSSRASRLGGWPGLRSPTTWDRTLSSSTRSAAPTPWLWRRARTERG